MTLDERLGPLVCTFMLIPILGMTTAFPAESKVDYKNMSVVELIDDLVNIDAHALGLHSTAWVRGFLAEDQPPEFAGGVLGSSAPKTFPQMRELIRRGVASLPLLIKHLDDKRSTKLTVGGDFFTFAYFGDEYDPKEPSKQDQDSLARIRDPKYNIPDRKYTVRVGDVCYALIGQIVNRSLLPVRYQPTAGLVVNSPIQEPSLIKWVKEDWDDIDMKGHMRSLIADAQEGFASSSSVPALQRLRFYYPEEYRRQASGSLKKKIEDFEATEKKQK